MLYKLGLLTVRLRWWIVFFWSLVFIASLPIAPRVTSVLKSGFGEADTESRAALRLMVDRMGTSQASITLVFSSSELQVTDPEYALRVENAVARLEDVQEVEGVVTYYETLNPHMVSSDRRTTYAFVLLSTSIGDSVDLVPVIRERLGDVGLKTWATGGIAILSDLDQASERDLRRAEIITVPIVLVVLIVVFGSVVAAGLPVALGSLSIVITLALVYVLAQRADMSIFVLNIATFLGLGMAIDYSLLMVSRFREELGRRDVGDAVAVTCATAGKAIFFSAGTSVIGLSGLLFFEFMMLRSLGIGGASVILLSMVLALTLMPALLAILGPKVNAVSIISLRFGAGRFWLRSSQWVMGHPLAVIMPVTILLLVLGAPFLRVRLGISWASILPKESEARRGWEFVENKFGAGELAPIVLISTSETGLLSKENIGATYDFVERISKDARVARVESIVSLHPSLGREDYQSIYSSSSLGESDGGEITRALDAFTSDSRKTGMIRIVASSHPVSDESKSLVNDLRASPPGGDLQTFVTGATPDLMDTVRRLYSDFPKVIIYVSVTTYISLLLLFRSVVLPLKAVLLNVMSILASFGALVFVFQQGHFQELLGFQAQGFTEASVPIILFSLVFGLSMDYEVFLLSRVKEEYELTGDNTASVANGMERSGRIITSSALVLIIVALGLATGEILIVKALGVGIALAIFVDATIVRVLLVPALMKVMSGLNWWAPRFLRPAT